jgi:hypothetical protein
MLLTEASMSSVSPEELVRLGGMPAWRYWARTSVVPERARSKSLVARSRAAGGSSEAEEGAWEGCDGCDVSCDRIGCGLLSPLLVAAPVFVLDAIV